MKFNNETIRNAVEEWLDNSKKAEKKYGHISDWDVSNVTDMNKLFNIIDGNLFNLKNYITYLFKQISISLL